jgi:calnexin
LRANPYGDLRQGKWDIDEGEETFAMPGEHGLVMQTEGAKYGISVKFDKPADFRKKDLILQYEFRIMDLMVCGGAYIKLFTAIGSEDTENETKWSTGENNFDPAALNGSTPFLFMFGPDRCAEIGRTHFLVSHRNRKSGILTLSEMWPALLNPLLESSPLTHLYRLEIDGDSGIFRIYVDTELLRTGYLVDDIEPMMQPPVQIYDPSDVKPSDWVDDEEIDDPNDIKPSDYDDIPAEILDPDAHKPIDWDDDSDGEWEHPTIPNPDYNGPWTPARIRNPAYKGKWTPRLIENPYYYIEREPTQGYWSPIGGLGFEVYSMQKDFMFNNIILTSDHSEADVFVELWRQKNAAEKLIKADIDWVHSPPWYRRWFENLLELSQESPFLFTAMLITLGLPFVFWAIINSDSPGPRRPRRGQPTTSTTAKGSSSTSPEESNKETTKAQEELVEATATKRVPKKD